MVIPLLLTLFVGVVTSDDTPAAWSDTYSLQGIYSACYMSQKYFFQQQDKNIYRMTDRQEKEESLQCIV